MSEDVTTIVRRCDICRANFGAATTHLTVRAWFCGPVSQPGSGGSRAGEICTHSGYA